MKQTSLFENITVYIPFMNFYEEKTCFAYTRHGGTITSNLTTAGYKFTFEDAKKLFNRHLRVLCPKELWQHYGLLKTTLDKLISYKVRYQEETTFGFRDKYIPVNKLMNDFEVINL